MTVAHAPVLRKPRPAAKAAEEACRLSDCRFCGLRLGEKDLFMELHGQEPYLPMPGIPDSLMVMLCAFPIAHLGGHLLIAPRRHFMSLARFQPESELRSTLEAVEETLVRMFPNHWLFAFEHGPGALENRPVKCGGCHVDHAHGHVLVLDRSVAFDEIRTLTEDVLEGLGWDLASQSFERELPFVDIAPFCGEQPYLHIGMLGRRRLSMTYKQVSAGQSIPSQLLRRLVATAAGKPAPSYWNWKIAMQHNLQDRLAKYGSDARGFQAAVHQFLATGERPV